MGSERKTDTGARHTSSSCSSVIAYNTSWSRHWEGKLSIPLTSDLGEYTISLETSRPLTNLTFWDGNLTCSETRFTLEGPPYFQGKTSGQILDQGFQLQYSGSVEPVFNSIKLNGVELCTGCNGGDTCCKNSNCHEGEGDCDVSSDCFGDLVCGFDNCRTGWPGDRSSFDATDDYCTSGTSGLRQCSNELLEHKSAQIEVML